MIINLLIEASSISVIGTITVSKVLAVMTLNDSMDAAAFKVYVSKCLVPLLSKGAVVVMDNLSAHKVKAIYLINPHHLRNWFAHCCYCLF